MLKDSVMESTDLGTENIEFLDGPLPDFLRGIVKNVPPTAAKKGDKCRLVESKQVVHQVATFSGPATPRPFFNQTSAVDIRPNAPITVPVAGKVSRIKIAQAQHWGKLGDLGQPWH